MIQEVSLEKNEALKKQTGLAYEKKSTEIQTFD